MSEVLLEAHLYESGLTEDDVDDLMNRRDEALRYLARSTGKRNARVIAQDLVDAATDKDALEKALVAAFDSMGFDAVPLGGPGKPDGLAAARLAGDSKGKPYRYKVSLEAKSKVLDYVVIHELAHTVEKNHSQSFWRKVAIMCPNYRSSTKWIEQNEHLLSL
jgi:hypothetical protein